MAYLHLACGKKLHRTGKFFDARDEYILGYRHKGLHLERTGAEFPPHLWRQHMKKEWEGLAPPKPSLLEFMETHLHKEHFSDISRGNVVVDGKVHDLGGDAGWFLWNTDFKNYECLEEIVVPMSHQLRMREFSPLAINKTATCSCETGDCQLEQHFAPKMNGFKPGQTNLLYGVCQGMKSRQAIAVMVVAWLENNYLPVLMTRNMRTDIGQWKDTMNSYNAFIGNDPGLRVHAYESAADVKLHVQQKREGVPVLILLYNKHGLSNVDNLWSYHFIEEEDRYRKIHLLIDEADVIAMTTSITSSTERIMWGKMFHDDAALITWVTATPEALYINKVHLGGRPTGLVKTFEIDVVSQYYRYKWQRLEDEPARTIGSGRADKVLDMVGTFLSTPNVRRGLVTTSYLAKIEAQKAFASQVAAIYNTPENNPLGKTVVCIAWNARTTVAFVGGPQLQQVTSGLSHINGFTVKNDGSISFSGRLPQLYDGIMEVVGVLLDREVRETDGPDIIVSAGVLANRGARLESSDHRWILTDMYMGEIGSWHQEHIVQVAGRLNGSSVIDTKKVLWLGQADQDRVRLAMERNADITETLCMDGYINMVDHIEALKEDVGEDVMARYNDYPVHIKAAHDKIGLSRAGVAKPFKRAADEFRDDIAADMKRTKTARLYLPDNGDEVTVSTSTLPASASIDLGQATGGGRARADFAEAWCRPDMENIFRAIADEVPSPASAKILADKLAEKGTFRSKGQAMAFLAFGRQNAGIVPWMNDTRAASDTAWVTFGHRGWSFNGTAPGTFIREIVELIGQLPVGDLFKRSDIKARVDAMEMFTNLNAQQRQAHLTCALRKMVNDNRIDNVDKGKGTYRVVAHY